MLSFLIMKLLQVNLVSQDVVGSEVKDSYEYEFFNNGYTCSHIEMVIKSYKWIDIEIRTKIEGKFNKSNDDLNTDVGCNSECCTVLVEKLSDGNSQVDAEDSRNGI